MIATSLRDAVSDRWLAVIEYPRTPARAVRTIAALTLAIAIVSGVAMRLVDGNEFPTVGLGLWWAAQTVTTVGYGDVVPKALGGRILALFVMLSAIGFMTVVTGAVTAALIDAGRQRSRHVSAASVEELRDLLETLLREGRED